MSKPIIACVRTGEKYSFDYVVRLRNMVHRHLHQPYDFYCLTDQPDRCSGATFVDVRDTKLHGWWAKMLLFAPEWRDHNRVIYLDLDTLVIDNVAPLLTVPGEFAICENFTRLAGNRFYPCQYNSSVMVIGGGMCGFVWDAFDQRRGRLMLHHDRYGDQACLEELYPDAPFLQHMLPDNFFCNYRDLTMHKPKHAAIVNFGGANKPHNCPIPWVREEWM